MSEQRVFGWSRLQWACARAWARLALPVEVGEDLVAAQDLQAAWRVHWRLEPLPNFHTRAEDHAWADAIFTLASARDAPTAGQWGRA